MGVSFEAQAPPAQRETAPRPFQAPRPNYNKLHAQPLPVKTYPLPPLIPHNPLSLIHIAFTYLFQLLVPPTSHPATPLRGYFSLDTRSVHIIDHVTARILWEQGFFGKGSLSRSEPAWLEREKSRQGRRAGSTSEDVTRMRREERKQFKTERARKEREVIEEKLAQEARVAATGMEGAKEITTEINGHVPMPAVGLASSASPVPPKEDERNAFPPSDMGTDADAYEPSMKVPVIPAEVAPNAILNQEHLQLTLEEAFFLAYGLGVLDIQEPSSSETMSTSKLFSVCRSNSYFPPKPPEQLSPDDPFLLSYVVYHHFRSLGWVVRPGIKFAVDHLLYNRGPVFTHAEFAVVVLPSYTHAYWSSNPELQSRVERKAKKSWWWLHCVNRVQAQVRKSLVLVYVEVPPPEEMGSTLEDLGEVADIGRFLKKYQVRELALKRWTPNRMRG
ncbi:MAG: hypothetical protein Q9206_002210 [Seirophora lacunosa]